VIDSQCTLGATGRPLRVGVLVYDDFVLSNLAGPIDILRIAQRIAVLRDPRTPQLFDSRVFSVGAQLSPCCSIGLQLHGVSAPEDDVDLVLVPGMMHSSPHQLAERVRGMQAELDLLRRWHARGVRIAAACSGTFLLAASGLLDGHRATTSWWLAHAFAREFPRVTLEADAMVIDDGPVLTAGAATAVLNLALKLVAAVAGDGVAQQTARMLNVDAERQSQAPYVSLALMERPRSSITERAEKLIQRELHRELPVAELAEQVGTSERSLLRHFRDHYGVTPVAHIQRLRVERAKALLETTQLSFDEVVERCGYSDVSSFRKLFKRATTLTPAEYRERFRLRA
jgi:transcriptional regulator GlxA family with amidase domain